MRSGCFLAAAMLMLTLSTDPVYAEPRGGEFSQPQQLTVKGKVVDESNEPMIGIAVTVEGTTVGTTTDINGQFTINADQNATLLFSFVGYQPQQVAVDARTSIEVQMQPSNSVMDDVVVIGYGTVKKRDLTGSVASIRSEDVLASPTSNAMEALTGKVAGLDIVKPTGQVGEDVSILLRGSRSIYGSNEPLFIIDGIPGSYSQVNPYDIETIDVLKDASSTAIYGSAGANGVIIITTKRGKEGKVNVNFDAYYGVSGAANYKQGMIGDEWINYQRESYKYQNGAYPTNMEALLGNQDYLAAYNSGKWIDWVDQVSGNTATTQKYSLSVSSGTEKTKVFASASYGRDAGLLENDNIERYNLRLNIDQQIFKWAKLGFTTNMTYSDRNQGVKNTFTKSLTAFPLGDVRDEFGEINHEYISGQYSPLGDFIPNQYANNTRNTYANLSGYLEIKPISDLTMTTRINTTLSHSKTGQYWGDQCNANPPSYGPTPFAQVTAADTWDYTWENIIAYNKTFAEDHTVGVSLISSWSQNQDESLITGQTGQEFDSWTWHNINDPSYSMPGFTRTQKMSYAVRLNYSFKGKYLVSFSNRWDGVSQFSEGHKWDNFPAGAVAWRISDEAFLKDVEWLDNLKLRVGYGVTGNSGGVGAYATKYQAYAYPAWGISLNGTYVPFTQYTGTVASSNLGWEKSYSWNVGLDFGVLNNVIDGSIEWYKTRTEGLLFKRTVPITSGLTGWGSPLTAWQNLAETKNSGIEVTINTHQFRRKNFTWDSTLSLSWSKEEIVSLPDGDLEKDNLFIGQPIQAVYGYRYAGIWGTDTAQETLDKYGVKPGFIKIETVEQFDKDGVGDGGVHKYSEKDRQILGHKNPNWIFGFNNTFTYRNFDLSIFVMGRFGQTITSDLLGYYTAEQSLTKNQLSGISYWTEQNQDAFYPRPGTGNEQSTVISALRVCDGSFFKVKTITLGYTLPVKLSRKALMEKLRVYATAYNPWIYVSDKRLKGTDPEMGGADNFPTYKQFVFGINITF